MGHALLDLTGKVALVAGRPRGLGEVAAIIDLPQNPGGKVLKNNLREMVSAGDPLRKK